MPFTRHHRTAEPPHLSTTSTGLPGLAARLYPNARAAPTSGFAHVRALHGAMDTRIARDSDLSLTSNPSARRPTVTAAPLCVAHINRAPSLCTVFSAHTMSKTNSFSLLGHHREARGAFFFTTQNLRLRMLRSRAHLSDASTKGNRLAAKIIYHLGSGSQREMHKDCITATAVMSRSI